MNPDEITLKTVSSTAELIDLNEELFPMNSVSPSTRWAFRGQPQTFGCLAPSFQRVFVALKSVGSALRIEKKLTGAFRTHYMNLDRTPNMPQPAAIGYTLDLRCLSVMQHYGVPTRLLDWTTDFWTAVYFACSGDPTADAELWYYDRALFEKQAEWMDDLGLLQNAMGDKPQREPEVLSRRDLRLVFELDLGLTPRMKKQQAHHTVSTDMFADHADLIYELCSRRDGNDPRGLHRIIIAKGCKRLALEFLEEDMKISASSIFPDVEGVGRFLRWQLDSLLTSYFAKVPGTSDH